MQTFKNNEWMRISVTFGLITDCCVTNYPKAHHLNNKHLSFLIVSVVCKFDRKLNRQLSCGLSQEVESEENQDCSSLKSLFWLEGVCKMACSHSWQIGTACWWGAWAPLKKFSSVTHNMVASLPCSDDPGEKVRHCSDSCNLTPESPETE